MGERLRAREGERSARARVGVPCSGAAPGGRCAQRGQRARLRGVGRQPVRGGARVTACSGRSYRALSAENMQLRNTNTQPSCTPYAGPFRPRRGRAGGCGGEAAGLKRGGRDAGAALERLRAAARGLRSVGGRVGRRARCSGQRGWQLWRGLPAMHLSHYPALFGACRSHALCTGAAVASLLARSVFTKQLALLCSGATAPRGAACLPLAAWTHQLARKRGSHVTTKLSA